MKINEFKAGFKTKRTKETREVSINRFNKSLEESSFLEDFQNIMIEILCLNRDKKHNPINIRRIINRNGITNSRQINTSIKKGFLVSCTLEPDFYILLQERIKEITGSYQPMDEFIHLLLTWFYHTYSLEHNKKKTLPYIRKYKNNRYKMVMKFNQRFSKYYKNTILDWNSI